MSQDWYRVFHSALAVCRTSLAALALLLCSAVPIFAQQLQSTDQLSSGTCHVRLKDGHFVIGNAHVERSWRWDKGQLYPESLLTLPERVEWLAPGTAAAPVGPSLVQGSGARLRAAYGTFGVTENSSLRAELEMTGTNGGLRYEFQIFLDSAGVRMWTEQTNPPKVPQPGTTASARPAAQASAVQPDTLDRLLLHNSHLRLTQVILRDRTDEHKELVFENE